MEYTKLRMLKTSEIENMEGEHGSLEEQVVAELARQNFHVCCAESCTGGMLSATLINVSGASAVLNEGYVTYSNEAKHRLLGVSDETLATLGAVSYETAAQMAQGAAKAAGAWIGLSTTGIAGPTGGTPEKPVGLVYIGLSFGDTVSVAECHFTGERAMIRQQTVKQVLALLLQRLQTHDEIIKNRDEIF